MIQSRLNKLRNRMKEMQVDAYLIFTDDFHGSEYVGDFFKAREYMSGFDGSSGQLLVLPDRAYLWTDGRYFLQAEEQLQGSSIQLMRQGQKGVPTLLSFLADELKDGDTVGFDGRCIQTNFVDQLLDRADLQNKEIYVEYKLDLVGEIWEDRPAMAASKGWLMKESMVGQSMQDRIHLLKKKMNEYGADAFLTSSLDEIAWLLLLRGNDIAYNPVLLSYLLCIKDHIYLYVNPASVTDVMRVVFSANGISIREYNQIYEDLGKLDAETVLLIDSKKCNYALYSSIREDVALIDTDSPITGFKAVKTIKEIENERIAHQKDGVCICKLLYWLKEQEEAIHEHGKLTELDVASKLFELRKEQTGYIEESFAPIIATGAHGAIIHYEPTSESNCPLEADSFLLMDLGSQYEEGTTDITRTIIIGKANQQQKEAYTAVLKGNLALGNAVFAEGITGTNLDILARQPLYKLGLDYNHGTGHGVGYLLNVHEGPQSIRPKGINGKIGPMLVPGMITSNEPGVYLPGRFGIRLENLTLVEARMETEFGLFFGFETLTLVPFDRQSIDPRLLSEEEKGLLNAYHKRVYDEISPFLTQKEKAWLRDATLPL